LSKHHTPNSPEKEEHTLNNLMAWIEKQDHKVLDDFVKRAQELSQKNKDVILGTLRGEFDTWCHSRGVTFKEVVNYGRKKRGPKKNGSAP
jgi:hypothetical protein